jgi:uncharacterized Fe-S cluster protein YjdI
MKRILLIIILTISAFHAIEAQEHISFNGAQLGQTLTEFQRYIKGGLYASYDKGNGRSPFYKTPIKHDYKDIYHKYEASGYFNENHCRYIINCSKGKDIVFEVTCYFWVSNLQEASKTYVGHLEQKYGGHIEEKKEDLGAINGKSEMFAFTYYIPSAVYKDKAIGEIRFAVAPSDNISGWIEFNYRGYAAAQIAIDECNQILDSLL